jgi:PhzF family phenazine biosynthesis protein
MAKKLARKAPARKPASRSKSAKPRKSVPRRSSVAAPPLQLPMVQVDAFTRRRFHGNPAAVVVLDRPKWLPDEAMQAIAAENNLAETAFVLRKSKSGPLAIRWFTPTTEMDLCGHATLAAAHVLWNHLGVKAPRLDFASASGKLPVTRSRHNGDEHIVLDFPARSGKPVPVTNAITDALGRAPVEAYLSRDLMCVFENRRDVYELTPDFAKLKKLDGLGVIVTAPGSGHDFVSRYFAPKGGIDEDPVTGSSHCTLVPYWAHVLGRNHLTAHQTSHRSGELFCELKGNRVLIGGHAVTYMTAVISV